MTPSARTGFDQGEYDRPPANATRTGTGRPPKFFTIPAGTHPSHCKSCHQVVYWITTASDRPMPVSVEYTGAFPPQMTRDGSGISHFVDCPERDLHRRAR